MKCLIWNLEWASPRSRRFRLIEQRIQEVDPGVICYTEVIRSVVPDGHGIESGADYGYSNAGNKKKVILWSKSPWSEVDLLGDPEMPSGRFVSGITQGVRFVGVCIPWKDAHVNTGRRDREPWQDHLSYCEGLQRVMDRYARLKVPICVLGDYNQRIPRSTQPERVAQALLNAIPPTFTIATAGIKDAEGKQLIDHVAVSSALTGSIAAILPRFAPDGTRLSDHVGIVAHIETIKAKRMDSPTRSARS